jgi:hypothetical protein
MAIEPEVRLHGSAALVPGALRYEVSSQRCHTGQGLAGKLPRGLQDQTAEQIEVEKIILVADSYGDAPRLALGTEVEAILERTRMTTEQITDGLHHPMPS